jgi:hypothetical protein
MRNVIISLIDKTIFVPAVTFSSKIEKFTFHIFSANMNLRMSDDYLRVTVQLAQCNQSVD